MTCTCAGTAPGYPQHEPYCGQPENDDLEEESWWDSVMQEEPTDD